MPARKLRPKAIATLGVVMEHPSSPGAAARVSAASKILEYSDGRPGQTKAPTVAGVALLSADEANEVALACLPVVGAKDRYALMIKLQYDYGIELVGAMKKFSVENDEFVMKEMEKDFDVLLKKALAKKAIDPDALITLWDVAKGTAQPSFSRSYHAGSSTRRYDTA